MKKQKRFIDFNQRLDNAVADCKKKCKCGHTKVVPYSTKYEYLICNWCGRRLYFDDSKQKEYDDKVAKNEFMFKLNKCLDQEKEDINKTMRNGRVIDKKKLKRRYFKSNSEYLTFCKNMTVQIYIVDTTSSKSGKIIVYYGAKLGRPKKQFIDKKNNYGRQNVRDIRRNVNSWVKKKYN